MEAVGCKYIDHNDKLLISSIFYRDKRKVQYFADHHGLSHFASLLVGNVCFGGFFFFIFFPLTLFAF